MLGPNVCFVARRHTLEELEQLVDTAKQAVPNVDAAIAAAIDRKVNPVSLSPISNLLQLCSLLWQQASLISHICDFSGWSSLCGAGLPCHCTWPLQMLLPCVHHKCAVHEPSLRQCLTHSSPEHISLLSHPATGTWAFLSTFCCTCSLFL